MKYNENNKPLVCMMTQSTCYKGTRRFTPKGVLWHSTGANNPNLKRYVQPDDKAPDRAEWLARLGKNQYGNDWNHIDRQAGMNFWIGKLADGTVAAVQTMPWDYRPWGCGSGPKGSCNNTHIQFEICEDALSDASYFNACYKEACEMTAYLCKMFGIDPKGTISYNGLKVPTIIDHTGSHALGLGSNHGDIQHWSWKYGKTMENIRNDVATLLAEEKPEAQPIITPITDAEYTATVDDGSYTNFVKDSAGYGLAQWTYWSRKQALLQFAQEAGKSIGDLQMQLDFLWQELQEYKSVLGTLKSAASVREASDAVLTGYEQPADQGDAVQAKRAGFGQGYYDKYAVKNVAAQPVNACTAATVIAVAVAQIGYKEKASNSSLNDKTANAGSANFTKYANEIDTRYPNWYNGRKNGYAWCDVFVDWCFLTAFGYEKALALLCQPEKSCGAGCTYSLRYYKTKGQFHTSGPQPGDQIFFGTSLDNATHTGIVESVDSKQVHTIEGNTSDQVARRNYSLTNSRILGYGRPAYDGAPVETPQPMMAPAAVPFLVRVSITDLNIRKGPGTNYAKTGRYTGKGVFTIMEVQTGQGSDSGWGRLKSGAGWISLDYATRL